MTPDHSVETRYLASVLIFQLSVETRYLTSIFRLHQFNYSNEHICQIDAKYRVSTFYLDAKYRVSIFFLDTKYRVSIFFLDAKYRVYSFFLDAKYRVSTRLKPFPQPRHRNPQGLSVFCHGAALHHIAFFGQQLFQFFIGMRRTRRFLLNNLPQNIL